MVFSSTVFLYIFLPTAILLYFVMPGQRSKNIMLALLSLVFYAWGEPVWVTLLIFSSLLDYTCGRVMGRFRGQKYARYAIYASVIINLGLLMTFKYSNFLIDTFNALTGLSVPGTRWTLPIGISFYTFQTLSYSIDVHRGNVKVQKSFWDFLLFVSLFPQLIAGPIVRYADVAAQLPARKTTMEEFTLGTTRFLCGLAKKILLANYAGAVTERLLAGSTFSTLTVTGAWVSMALYTFHIYFDFSGYSDMAIGLGRMFGFSYPENFDHPFMSTSITEFWRRWHISLGGFLRDYVYIPLGGSRRGLLMQIRNMFIVMALTGLWHGASWNFVIWGLWFFAFLCIEKLVGTNKLGKIPGFIGRPYTFLVVMFSLAFFYFESMSDAGTVLSALLGRAPGGFVNTESRLALINSIPLFLLCIFATRDFAARIARRYADAMSKGVISISTFSVSAIIYNTLMLALSTVSLMGSTYNPFIYFRF